MEECNFLRCLPAENFRENVLALAENAAKFSLEAMKVTKELIRSVDRELLLKVNEIEMEKLAERMESSDSLESIMAFVGKCRCIGYLITKAQCLNRSLHSRSSKA